MAGGNSYTIVEYFGGDDGYRCGYCKNEKGNFSHDEPMDSLCEETGLRRSAKACHSQVEVAAVPETKEEVVACPPANSETSGQDAPPTVQDVVSPAATPKPGMGADPARPPCRKAKDLRKERRLRKEQMKCNAGEDAGSAATPPTPAALGLAHQPKPLEAFIHESLPDGALHCLEVRLVRSSPPCPQFKASFDASYQVYKLYQMAIHKDPPDKPSESQFRRFLCDSPLEQLQNVNNSILDFILLFFCADCSAFGWNCGQYLPSDLLCPETFAWVPIERCIARLENARYARFNQDPDAGDARTLKDVTRAMVLYKRTVMPYGAYCRKRKGPCDREQVEQYATLLGQTTAESILLYRA
ncbi:unnamed protein product [Merluccius merluccius]